MNKDLIDIRQRLNAAIFEKFGSFYHMAKRVNKSPSFFYGYRNLQSIDSIKYEVKMDVKEIGHESRKVNSFIHFSDVLCHSVVSDSLQPHGL